MRSDNLFFSAGGRLRALALRPGFWAAVSGVLTAAAYRFEALWWLCFFSLIPFCFMLLYRVRRTRRVTGIIFCYCFAYYGVTLLWLFEMVTVLAPVTGEVGAALIITGAIAVICLIMAAVHSLPMLLFRRARTGSAADCFVLGALYAAGELLIGAMGDLAFPWARLCNITVPFLPFVQSSALFGGTFVSFLIMAVNCLFARAAAELMRLEWKKSLWLAAAAVMIFTLNSAGGAIRMGISDNKTAALAKTETLVVQGDFPSNEKWMATSSDMLSVYLSLSQKNIKESTRLVIWPESAITTDLTAYPSYTEKLRAFTKENGVWLITGALKYTSDGQYNVAYMISPDGSISAPYAKQLLVPMGEYIPFRNILCKIPGLSELMADTPGTELLHGRETVIFDTPWGGINSIICYESIQPALQRNACMSGSALTVMITNDSWFGTSAALRQHLSHARLRAAASGKYLVRAGNSGITAFISPCGRIEAEMDTYCRGTLEGSVAFLDGKTVYSAIGDIPMWLLLVPCIALFVRGAIFGFRLRLRAAQGFIEGSFGDNIKHKNTGNKPRIGAKKDDKPRIGAKNDDKPRIGARKTDEPGGRAKKADKPGKMAKKADEHGVLSEPEPGASGSAETPGTDGQDAGDDGENAKNT